jgi:hypothetical protein
MRNAWVGFASALAVCIFVGCSKEGPAIAPASGVVTFNGQPLEGARVMFHPQGEGARFSHGTTDANGNFKLSTFGMNDGALVGSHKVTITKVEQPADAPKFDPAKLKESGYAGMEGYEKMMGMGKSKAVEPEAQIPEKYGDVATSNMEVEVTTDGPNEYTFNLE